jgi:cation diffusion facilitator family transporter
MQDGSRKAVIAACAAHAGIGVAKLVGFFFTGASSMLAEAVHSAADTGNQALLLLGGTRAQKAATAEHPFGYGRERYFWAFIVALVIFMLGAVFAIVEGIEKIRHPHELKSPLIAVGILGVSLFLEGASFMTAIKEGKKLKGEHGWWQFIRRSKDAELPVVLLEDLGALIGLVVALVSVGLAHFTGDPRFDGVGSLVIGLLLGAIAVILAFEMQSLLIGESARPEEVEDIERTLASAEHVERVVHIRTMHLAPEELLVAAKIQLSAHLDFRGVAQAIDAAETAIRAAYPIAKVIYLEPDVFDPERSRSEAPARAGIEEAS